MIDYLWLKKGRGEIEKNYWVLTQYNQTKKKNKKTKVKKDN